MKIPTLNTNIIIRMLEIDINEKSKLHNNVNMLTAKDVLE
jgi:hypothetical protein